ncbi:MAG: AI-2E family transporter [Pseudomonadota bacterium]
MENAQPNATPAAGRASRRLDLRDVFYVLGLITLTFFILRLAAPQLVPIIFALLLWFVINAIAAVLRRIPVLGRLIPMWLALLLGAVSTLSLGYAVAQLIVSNVAELSSGLRQFGPKADAAIAAAEAWIGVSFDVKISPILENLKVSDLPLDQWLPAITEALTSTASNLAIVLLYVLFLLIDQPYYQNKIRALFPDDARYDRARHVLARIANDTRVYIGIMTMLSLGVGLFTYAAASYFGIKGAAFWGFLAFALNFIPTIGSFLGVAFPAAFALVQLESFEEVGLFVLGLALVQFLAGNVILPRVTGNQLNLSEFVVILSLTVFGALWGVAGLFLAVPLTMVSAIILSQFDSTRPVAILLSKNGRVMGDDLDEGEPPQQAAPRQAAE